MKATEEPRPDNGQEIEEQEQEEEYCNPLNSDCENCPDLQDCEKVILVHSARIPHWLIDDYLSKVSPLAWKLFTFLFRKATFQEGHTNFGRCYPSNDEISQKTGISKKTIWIYARQLMELGFIDYKKVHRINKEGQVRSHNQYTVLWYPRKKELKEVLRKLKD